MAGLVNFSPKITVCLPLLDPSKAGFPAQLIQVLPNIAKFLPKVDQGSLSLVCRGFACEVSRIRRISVYKQHDEVIQKLKTLLQFLPSEKFEKLASAELSESNIEERVLSLISLDKRLTVIEKSLKDIPLEDIKRFVVLMEGNEDTSSIEQDALIYSDPFHKVPEERKKIATQRVYRRDILCYLFDLVDNYHKTPTTDSVDTLHLIAKEIAEPAIRAKKLQKIGALDEAKCAAKEILNPLMKAKRFCYIGDVYQAKTRDRQSSLPSAEIELLKSLAFSILKEAEVIAEEILDPCERGPFLLENIYFRYTNWNRVEEALLVLDKVILVIKEMPNAADKVNMLCKVSHKSEGALSVLEKTNETKNLVLAVLQEAGTFVREVDDLVIKCELVVKISSHYRWWFGPVKDVAILAILEEGATAAMLITNTEIRSKVLGNISGEYEELGSLKRALGVARKMLPSNERREKVKRLQEKISLRSFWHFLRSLVI